MNNTKTGGPAFPSHGSMGEVAHEGMTLRDYFAAEAMQADIIGAQGIDRRDLNVECKEIAETAYKMADAMLKARQ